VFLELVGIVTTATNTIYTLAEVEVQLLHKSKHMALVIALLASYIPFLWWIYKQAKEDLKQANKTRKK
jgi:hypothetical protein